MPMSHDDRMSKMPALAELVQRAQARFSPTTTTTAAPMNTAATSPEVAEVDAAVAAGASAEVEHEALLYIAKMVELGQAMLATDPPQAG